MPDDPPYRAGLRPVVPLLAVLTLAALLFVALSAVEGRAEAAALLDGSGANRGAIIDEHGNPLATVREHSGRLVLRYAAPSMATALGYQLPGGRWTGLEERYASLLSGKSAMHDWRTFFLHLHGQSVKGGTLQLTIDSRLQRVAAQALGAAQGAVVALRPSTGAVLAYVSAPTCSARALATASGYRRCRDAPTRPLLSRPTQLAVPPGSAFKIVTLTAALATKRFTPASVFSGADAFGPSPYFDNSEYPSNVTRSDLTQLTLFQALAFSDNFTFAHIGLTLGAQTLLSFAHRYMIGKHIPFDFPVVPSTIANGQSHPNLSVLAQSSFGAETDRVTPLQMALIAATVANHGVMMAPHLVQSTRDASGHVQWQATPHVLSHVMSPAAANLVTQGMEFVVKAGSGYKAQINNLPVAGKTGTAASGKDKPNAWFIAFAPANHPIVAVAVLHEYSGEGFEYAAPIARKVMIAALREAGLVKKVGPPPQLPE